MSNSTNNITTLRDHLFDTLKGLQDRTNPMEIERAKAITDVAQVIINAAKVEVEHIRVTGGEGSGFIPNAQRPTKPALPQGTHSPTPGVLVHRIGDR